MRPFFIGPSLRCHLLTPILVETGKGNAKGCLKFYLPHHFMDSSAAWYRSVSDRHNIGRKMVTGESLGRVPSAPNATRGHAREGSRYNRLNFDFR